MTDFLLLDADQAAAVRGATEAGYDLEPRETVTAGVFALPLAVLSDPHHADRWALLDDLPRGPAVFPDPDAGLL